MGYTFHGVAKSQTQLSDFTFTFHPYDNKQRGIKEPLDEGERIESKSWLKIQHSKN